MKAGLKESSLTWYKVLNNTCVAVEKSKTSQDRSQLYIDSEILIFKDYKVTDGGKYVCQRKVQGEKITFNFVNIVHERKLLSFSIFVIFKEFTKCLKWIILDIFERLVVNILFSSRFTTYKSCFVHLS